MPTYVKPRRKKKADLLFAATCGAGLEELVAGEIHAQGGRNTVINPGAVSWEGNLEAGYRMCLWSRFASRILLQIGRFDAPDPDTLYREAGKIDWDAHFSGNTTFAVFSTITDSPISHSKYAALRVKDAIVDQFRSRTRRRPDVDPARPGVRFNLHLRGEQATLAIDLSGESLHRRGYRVMSVEAPLKETLAAGIVHFAGFTPDFPTDAVLLDPMCGSGTLLIEAAMVYGDVAPGLQRKSYGFLAWNRHDSKLWERLVNEAVQREEEGLEKPWPQIIGYDADPHAVKAARQNIEAAGLDEKIQVNQRQLAFLRQPHKNGMMLINPPYGERLSDREEIKYLYRCIGRKIGQELDGWKIGFFAANPDLIGSLKMEWQESFRLYNGPIKCKLHNGIARHNEIITTTRPDPVPPDPEMEGIDFANRLMKNYTSLQPWAEREDITCFRIYDADMPEYNFAVDLYEEWVHVQEYAPPSTVDKDKAHRRLQVGLNVIRHTLNIPPSRLFIKTRRVQKGKKQYQKQSTGGKLFEVREQQCRFLVNFTDYLDTGLFLDHRSTRAMLGRMAHAKTFLNLYGYTGSATVHALMNNASATTTVDTSGTYLQRARSNFSLNGFGGPQHQTVEQDCIKWLEHCRDRFALIFVDPPTFSNDRHRKTAFTVQEDHEKLLRLSMQRLSRDGLLVFSTNFRKFSMAESLEKEFDVREISAATIPEDFKKNPRIHRCWEFRHRSDTTR
ncbi:MAG TPA: bifunctional 23S rRNA (guanine(2069)-N(7))-methyltransferase RlmK/23S rRNA (guanine(2445)-N(2))-methyltransferase RlmL [Desulfobacteraceae bacterium]|nr:bifunctional 23S rRNA (guanine(2069)-N(7))-methyltransferase RlmK/23S rRNA (guanine(2445)-N(2))-methyltransferase RlmL [Desulfobacteraceae bacterium]